jgi:hypothetical protein
MEFQYLKTKLKNYFFILNLSGELDNRKLKLMSKKNLLRSVAFYIATIMSIASVFFLTTSVKKTEAAGTPQQPTFSMSFNGSVNPDISPTGKSPTVTGTPVYADGLVGQAMQVGSSDSADLNFSNQYANPKKGSAVVWVKPLDWKTGDGKQSNFFNVGRFSVYTYGTGASFTVNSSVTGYPNYELYYGDVTFTQGQWTQIGITWLDNVLSLYVNGQKVRESILRAPLTDADVGYIFFGRRYNTTHTLLDEFYLYDYALSPQEMQQVYSSYSNGSTSHLATNSDAKLMVVHRPAAYKIQAFVDLTHNNYSGNVSRAEIIATDSQNHTFQLGTMTDFSGNISQSLFNLPKEVAAGQVAVSAILKDSGGNTLDTLMAGAFEKMKFFWEDNHAGESGEVIPPFTPLQVSGNTVSAWGRDYTFANSGFPSAITSRNASMLAYPVTLAGTNDHGVLSFSDQETLETVSAAPNKVTLKGTSTADGGRVTVENNIDIEYDGMMKYTVKIIPDPAGVNFTNLHLDIPLKNENAILLHPIGDLANSGWGKSGYLPSGSGMVWNSKTFKKSNQSEVLGTFLPYFWLGDYDRGLAFMADNDKGWISDDNNAEVEFIREGGALIARLNLFNTPKTITEPREIVFALEASPARPEPANWRAAPWGDPNWSSWGSGDLRGSFEGFTRPPDLDYFKSRMRALQSLQGQANQACAGYSPKDFWDYPATYTDENRYFQLDWAVGNTSLRGEGNILPQRNQCIAGYTDTLMKDPSGSYINCYYSDDNSVFPKYDFLNGTAYVRDDGKIQAGYTMFAHRDYYKRLATVFRDNHGPYGMMIHMTDYMVVPSYSFWDSKHDNERGGQYETDPIGSYSLGNIVTTSMSRQYGMAASWHDPKNWSIDIANGGADLGTLQLLHDILGRSSAVDERATPAKKIFGIGESDVDFMGYWLLQPDKDPKVKDIKMSAWVRKSEGTALIVVGNLTTSDWTGDMDIPLSQMGLSVDTVFSDGEYPHPSMNLTNEKLNFSVPAHNFRVILAGPPGKFPVDVKTTFEKPGNVDNNLSDNFDSETLSSDWHYVGSGSTNAQVGQIKIYGKKLLVLGGDYSKNVAERPFNQDNVSVQVRVDRVTTMQDYQGLALAWANGNFVFAGPQRRSPDFKFDYQMKTAGKKQDHWGSSLDWSNPDGSPQHNWVRIDLKADKIIFYGSNDGKTWFKDWEVVRPADLMGAPAVLRLGRQPMGDWGDYSYAIKATYFDDLIVGKYFDADLNQDSKIDSTDLDILKTDFLKLTANLSNPRSDINADGNVNVVDLGILMSEWK